jgi:hypothetical protein
MVKINAPWKNHGAYFYVVALVKSSRRRYLANISSFNINFTYNATNSVDRLWFILYYNNNRVA